MSDDVRDEVHWVDKEEAAREMEVSLSTLDRMARRSETRPEPGPRGRPPRESPAIWKRSGAGNRPLTGGPGPGAWLGIAVAVVMAMLAVAVRRPGGC